MVVLWAPIVRPRSSQALLSSNIHESGLIGNLPISLPGHGNLQNSDYLNPVFRSIDPQHPSNTEVVMRYVNSRLFGYFAAAFARRHAAQRFLVAAIIRFRPAALILRLAFTGVAAGFP